jgi:hypothetical protein
MPRGTGRQIGSPQGNPAGFIADAIRGGLSANRSLTNFRAAGGAIRRQTWLNLFGEVRASLGRIGDIAGLDPNVPPPPGAFTDSSWGRDGSYMYRIDVLVRRSGESEFEPRPFWYTSDDLISPWRAIEIGLDAFDAATQVGGSWEDEAVGGAVLVGLNRMGQR